MTIEAILKDVLLFRTLPTESLSELAKLGQILSFKSSQVVCCEGEESDVMYIILDGQVRVFKQNKEGDEVDIAVLKSGEFFGEMALVDSQPRSATIACITPCRLFMLEKLVISNLFTNPKTQHIAFSIIAALVQRMRSIMIKYYDEELAQRTLHAEMEAERHRSLAQMVAGVAHELNTPLGIVNTAIGMIEKRLQSDKLVVPLGEDKAAQAVLADMKEVAQLAGRNISRAHKLVRNFKKTSVSQLTDIRETANLSSLVLDIIELFRINARQSQLQIEVNNTLPGEQKDWSGYPGHLTQVLTNLLFNIDQYAYPNQAGGRIEVRLSVDNERKPGFVLAVRDFGRGIAPEHLSQVFEPFFTTGRGQGGSGLGLAIVHNIVTDALQGSIVVESELNEGTTFTVTFPQIIP